MTKINKIIHQIWLGNLPPPKKWLASWEEHHPDWEYKLWTDKNAPTDLINQKEFDASPEYNRKSDILRYELLHRFGGVYIDADMICLKPIDDLLEIEEDIFFTYEPITHTRYGKNNIVNGVIGCTKNNSKIKKLIDKLENDLSKNPVLVTGPVYVHNMIKNEKWNVKVYPSHYFYPFDVGFLVNNMDKLDLNNLHKHKMCKDSYAVHFWGHTGNHYLYGR